MVGATYSDGFTLPKCLCGFGIIKNSIIFQNYYRCVMRAGFDTPTHTSQPSSEKILRSANVQAIERVKRFAFEDDVWFSILNVNHIVSARSNIIFIPQASAVFNSARQPTEYSQPHPIRI